MSFLLLHFVLLCSLALSLVTEDEERSRWGRKTRKGNNRKRTSLVNVCPRHSASLGCKSRIVCAIAVCKKLLTQAVWVCLMWRHCKPASYSCRWSCVMGLLLWTTLNRSPWWPMCDQLERSTHIDLRATRLSGSVSIAKCEPAEVTHLPQRWCSYDERSRVANSMEGLASKIWLLGADEETMWFTNVFRVCLELSWALRHTWRGMKSSVMNEVVLCYQKASWRNSHREFKCSWKGSRCEPEGPAGSRVHQWVLRDAVMDAAAGMLEPGMLQPGMMQSGMPQPAMMQPVMQHSGIL